MSSGSVPGSSGDTMMLYLLAGVAAFGGLFYAYRAVSSSRSRFIERTNILRERAEERKSNPWSRKVSRLKHEGNLFPNPRKLNTKDSRSPLSTLQPTLG